MEAEAAKYIGAGLACLGMAGTALGLGNIFGNSSKFRFFDGVRRFSVHAMFEFEFTAKCDA